MSSSWTDRQGLCQGVPIPHTTREQRANARRFVASRAEDAGDCRWLLLMLGLIEEVTR